MTTTRAPAEAPPDLAVVLVTPDDGRSLGRILRHLRAQSAASRMEVLIAAEEPDRVVLGGEAGTGFAALRLIRADVTTSACGRASAIRASSAPVVVFCEDHSFPMGDQWAARIIEAHRADYAAIGPLIANANPASATSWANLAVEYAPFLRADRPVETRMLPGHNSSYKRAALLAFDNRLEGLLEVEMMLHEALTGRGDKLLLDPSLRVEHLNYARPLQAFRLQFLSGRMFAASRAEDWPWRRRLLYGCAWPLIPPLRLVRTLAQLARLPGGVLLTCRAGPMVALLLLLSGVGEGLGYLFGDGGRRADLARMEFNRQDKLLAGEQGLMA